MKTLVRISILFLIINMGLWLSPEKAGAQQSNYSFQLFYDQLSPYGTWVMNRDYGYVWLPDVDEGFSPYVTDGHWEYTDYGWTWVSDFVWGWAPFHYGRWLEDPYYGAMWVPDDEWGPAWVTWRRADGYFGWTPMAPGININLTFGRDYYVPSERWVFVRDRDFCRHDINRYYMDQTNNYTIINRSTVIINVQEDNSRHFRYATGPDRNEVQQRTNIIIRPLAVRENDRPGQSIRNNQLTIYRPNVRNERNDRSNDNRPAPSRVARMQDVRPVSERNMPKNARYDNQQQNSRNNNDAPVRNARREDSQHNEQPARNVNPANNRRNDQPSRNINPANSQRNEQPARNVNPANNQRYEQPARNVNPANNQRYEQPARNVNPANNQRNEQPARNVNPANSQRNEQPARNMNPANNQRNEQPAQNARPAERQSNGQPAQQESRDKKAQKENKRNGNTDAQRQR